MNLVVKFSCSNDPFINLQTFGVKPNIDETFYSWKPANICLDGFLFPNTVFHFSILLVCGNKGTIMLKDVEISCGMLNYSMNHILKVQDIEICYFAKKYYEDEMHLGRIAIDCISLTHFELPPQKDRITCCLNYSCYLGTFQRDYMWISSSSFEKQEMLYYIQECDLIYPTKICTFPNYTTSFNKCCALPFLLPFKTNLLMEFYNFCTYFPSKMTLTILWQDFIPVVLPKSFKMVAKRSLNRYHKPIEELGMLTKGIVKIIYKKCRNHIKIVHILFNVNYIKLFV